MRDRTSVLTLGALLVLCAAHATAQNPTEPLIAWSLDTRVGGRPGLAPVSFGGGLSVRAVTTPRLSARIGIGAAGVHWGGDVVCIWDGGAVGRTSCDTRQLQAERSVGMDARWSLPSARYYVHSGAGVLWMDISGTVYHSSAEYGHGSPRDTRPAVGFVQMGIGRRSRPPAHARWFEMGAERNAATRHVGVYLRAAFGL